VARRGVIAWNTLVPELNDDIDNVKKYAIMARRSKALLLLDFDCREGFRLKGGKF